MLKIGYNNLPNFKDINFNSSRQGILFNQLIKEGTIKIEDVAKLVPNHEKLGHWIEMKHKHNNIKASYIDSLATKMLKEGAIYDSLDTIAEGIVERSLASGGSTTYVSTGLAVKSGYALAAANSPEETYGDLTPEIVKSYIEKHYDNYLKNEGNYLGTWLDGGTWYLDVSEVILGESEENKKQAIEIAKDRNQIAIYDLYKNETVRVDEYLANVTSSSNVVEKIVRGKETIQDIINLSNKLFK